MLRGKKILLGVCGSIAAYKTAFLIRLLVKNGAEVRVIMTPSSRSFISPLTLGTLSKNKVLTDLTDDEDWNNHVELGLWADCMLIAPATANTIAKMAGGFCDNLLTASYLSAKCPVMLAPAMDLDMWKHPATKKNIETIMEHGVRIIPVGEGDLASGLVGEGRMAEPEEIIQLLEVFFQDDGKKKGQLKNKQVLVTAGPTQEPIDPVRYIGNRSSGKMGTALVSTLLNEGAIVTLVKGPFEFNLSHDQLRVIDVETAEEMYQAVMDNYNNKDIAILAAAVADFSPVDTKTEKIKKSENPEQLSLKKTRDILKELGKRKKKEQILVGFALETTDAEKNAKKKLKDKNLDLVILNSLRDKGAGFQHETNKITMIDRSNKIEKFGLKDKSLVARDIINKIISLQHA